MAEVKHSIYFVSLGCDKNRVDSEYMIAMLQNRGYSITDELSKADTAVVNTCCFIGDAAQESMNTVLELAELRKSG
ncbi:MAG TPA: 30S ribosomal protein S12 methylthiotransferase RimO, partial [Lachnospiraceae bacterium]|nr:30S ribosomal protein S12 methylthiotransferase RimO [Lachnospiraceae bacterium]